MAGREMTEWSDYDAESNGFDCEPGVGLTILDDIRASGGVDQRWFSWDETLGLHAWLTRKIEEAQK